MRLDTVHTVRGQLFVKVSAVGEPALHKRRAQLLDREVGDAEEVTEQIDRRDHTTLHGGRGLIKGERVVLRGAHLVERGLVPRGLFDLGATVAFGASGVKREHAGAAEERKQRTERMKVLGVTRGEPRVLLHEPCELRVHLAVPPGHLLPGERGLAERLTAHGFVGVLATDVVLASGPAGLGRELRKCGALAEQLVGFVDIVHEDGLGTFSSGVPADDEVLLLQFPKHVVVEVELLVLVLLIGIREGTAAGHVPEGLQGVVGALHGFHGGFDEPVVESFPRGSVRIGPVVAHDVGELIHHPVERPLETGELLTGRRCLDGAPDGVLVESVYAEGGVALDEPDVINAGHHEPGPLDVVGDRLLEPVDQVTLVLGKGDRTGLAVVVVKPDHLIPLEAVPDGTGVELEVAVTEHDGQQPAPYGARVTVQEPVAVLQVGDLRHDPRELVFVTEHDVTVRHPSERGPDLRGEPLVHVVRDEVRLVIVVDEVLIVEEVGIADRLEPAPLVRCLVFHRHTGYLMGERDVGGGRGDDAEAPVVLDHRHRVIHRTHHGLDRRLDVDVVGTGRIREYPAVKH